MIPRLIVVAGLVLFVGGCASLGKPDWLDPGPAARQRRKAVRFDPY
jgi:hypothetical protein